MAAPGPRQVTVIEAAVSAMGAGPLTEDGLQRHVAPLFSRVRAAFRDRIYLANHSLGRPLDAVDDDLRECTAAWYTQLSDAWDAWGTEMRAYRHRLAQLLNAPRDDCVVPKNSAGQGLRAVLNTFDTVPRVVATRGEFDSLDVILREYARRGRIVLTMVEPRGDGRFDTADIVDAIGSHTDLVVISQVIFTTGQRLADSVRHRGRYAPCRRTPAARRLPCTRRVSGRRYETRCRLCRGRQLQISAGGPGACYLYLHPRHLDGSLRTLDTGWFAKRDPFAYVRPDPPQYGHGGDAFLESTPPVLPFYQARAGQIFTLKIGVERIREHSLGMQLRLTGLLRDRGIVAQGGTEDRGAFVVVVDDRAEAWATQLEEVGIVTDARGRYLRLCPDLLTTEAELATAANALAKVSVELV